MTVLTCLLFAFHTGRRVDPRHVTNMLGKLKHTDPVQYERMLSMKHNNIKVSAKDLEKNVYFQPKN